MRKLIPLVWAVLLVVLPLFILLTGNAALEPVAKWSIYGYTSLAATYAAVTALTIFSSLRLWGKDLGEASHAALMKTANKINKMSWLRFMTAPVTVLLSSSLLSIIGLPHLAILVAVALVLVMGARLAEVRYAERYGDIGQAERKTAKLIKLANTFPVRVGS